MKFEKAGPDQTLVVNRTRLHKTDRLTDRQVQGNIPPLLRNGDIKKSRRWVHKKIPVKTVIVICVCIITSTSLSTAIIDNLSLSKGHAIVDTYSYNTLK